MAWGWAFDGPVRMEHRRQSPIHTPAALRCSAPLSETEAMVELMVAEEGVAPGQACVFYDPDGSRVLGGGWITHG